MVVQEKNKKWERAGRIVEVLLHRQYRIRMFHSGRVALRNRRFLRKYTAIHPEDIRPLSIETQASTPAASTPASESTPQASAPAPYPLSIETQESVPAPSTLVPTSPIPETECSTPSSSNLPTQSEGIPPGDSQKTATTQKLPRALKNLQSFNKPGIKDRFPLGGRR